MPDHVLLEEFHLTLSLPARMPDGDREAIRGIVNSQTFRASLRKAIREVIRTIPALVPLRVAVST